MGLEIYVLCAHVAGDFHKLWHAVWSLNTILEALNNKASVDIKMTWYRTVYGESDDDLKQQSEGDSHSDNEM